MALTTLRMKPAETFIAYGPPSYRESQKAGDTEAVRDAMERARIIGTEAVESRFARALASPRQLEERMVEFWYNHFNVLAGKGLDRLWIGAYEMDAIRPHVLGKFRDLLGATAKHPAMLFYLDNWQNTAPGTPAARGQFTGLNENYARELMELHTLGVNGGYGQDDVIALARVLTGWGFGGDRDGDATPRLGPMAQRMRDNPNLMRLMAHNARSFKFNADRHDPRDKRFLGQTIKGRDGDAGLAEGEQALDILAHHPATARFISFKLAQFFVADQPRDALVAAMAKTFESSHGDIRAVLQTMIHSADIRDPANFGTRFKTPYQYIVSAVRAADLPVRNVKPLFGTLSLLGQPLYGCQTPDGYKCTEEAWLSPDAVTRRISFAVGLGAGRLALGADPDPKGLNVRRPANAPHVAPRAAAMMLPPAPEQGPAPVPLGRVLDALGDTLSPATLAVVRAAAPQLQAGLLLGSPDFMRC